MKRIFIYLFFLFIAVQIAACDSASKGEKEVLSNHWELEIKDSIQVNYLGQVSGGEFRNGKGIIFDFKSNSLIEFDSSGHIINQQSYSLEGPGSVWYPNTLRYGEDGVLYGKSFTTWIYEFNADLTLKREIKMPFVSESKDGAYFARNLEVWENQLVIWYPGRDGVNPYDPHFFKDHYILEKISLETDETSPLIKIPSTSRFSTDKYFERPFVQFGIVLNKLYLILDNEPLIHVYDLTRKGEFIKTIPFNPSKFMDNGEHPEKYQYVSGRRMLDGRIKHLFPLDEAVCVIYDEGIEEDRYLQNELNLPENYPNHRDFQRQILKVMTRDSIWSNEIVIPNTVGPILNIESLDKPFFALRNDDYLGEEQDYLTFYKLRLVQK